MKHVETTLTEGTIKGELRQQVYGHAAGTLAYGQGDPAAAGSLYREGLELARGCGDPRLCADFLNNLGLLAMERSELEEARELYAESLRLRDDAEVTRIESTDVRHRARKVRDARVRPAHPAPAELG